MAAWYFLAMSLLAFSFSNLLLQLPATKINTIKRPDNIGRCFLNILQRYGNNIKQSIIYLTANIDARGQTPLIAVAYLTSFNDLYLVFILCNNFYNLIPIDYNTLNEF